jgi:sialic acid synthase SpsE
MLTFKRPGDGISPDDIDKLLGKKTVKNIKEDEQIEWEIIQ